VQTEQDKERNLHVWKWLLANAGFAQRLGDVTFEHNEVREVSRRVLTSEREEDLIEEVKESLKEDRGEEFKDEIGAEFELSKRMT
jgi:hypothetical protein